MTRTLALSIPIIMLCGMNANAATEHLSINFSSGAPAAMVMENADQAPLADGLYRHLPNEDNGWFVNKLKSPYNRCALSPTYLAEEGKASCNRMILPSLSVANDAAVLTWEARSLHKYVAESYYVAVRPMGQEAWTSIYEIGSESHQWTHHSVALADYAGQEIEIAFVATTIQGFMLAVDNIEAGVLSEPIMVLDDKTAHFVSIDDNNTVCGVISNYGVASGPLQLRLEGIGSGSTTIDLPSLGHGEEVEFAIDIKPELGQCYDYALTLTESVGADGYRLYNLGTALLSCSYMPRTHFLDRFSGTWCNNCPTVESTVTSLENWMGSQLIVVEAHISDVLANTDYAEYYTDFAYSIPRLDLNHRPVGNGLVVGSAEYRESLAEPTYAIISAKHTIDAQGNISIVSNARFAYSVDNIDDRYRVGYLVVGDFHDPANFGYRQENSTTVVQHEQFYYLSTKIPASMTWYEHVPVNAKDAVSGVCRSLPQSSLSPGEEYQHKHIAALPADYKGENTQVIAMLFDANDGSILNSCLSEYSDDAGVGAIEIDGSSDIDAYYDVYGRRVEHPGRGIYIKMSAGKAAKILNR